MANFEYFHFFDRNAERCIGFSLGNPRKLSRTIADTVRSKPGYLVDASGHVSPWNIQGVTTVDNNLIAWAPSPQDWVSAAQTTADPLGRFERICRAMYAVSQVDSSMVEGQFTPISCFEHGGSVLLLAPILGDLIASNMSPEDQACLVEPYRYASQNQKDRFKSGLAVWMYEAACKNRPFVEHEGISLDWARHHGLMTPLALQGVELDLILADFLEKALHHHQFPSTVKTYLDMAIALNRPGAIRTPDTKSLAKAQRYMKSAQKRCQRSIWIKRHGSKALTISLVTLLLAIIPYTMISKALEPPKTMGQSPEMVILNFYQAANDYDLEYMEDAVLDRDRNSLIGETQNAMLISKVRMASERREVILKVADWRKAGAPVLTVDLGLFGYEDLVIKRFEKRDEATYFAEVAYTWYDTFLIGPAEGVAEYIPQPEQRIDTMTLILKDGAWIIEDYQRSTKPQK